MAAKTGWHRYGTKSRHCHAMYTVAFIFKQAQQARLHDGRDAVLNCRRYTIDESMLLMAISDACSSAAAANRTSSSSIRGAGLCDSRLKRLGSSIRSSASTEHWLVTDSAASPCPASYVAVNVTLFAFAAVCRASLNMDRKPAAPAAAKAIRFQMSYFKAKMHKIRFRLGSAPDLAGRGLQHSPSPQLDLRGPTFKGKEGKESGGSSDAAFRC